jgi:predicted transcriptional regulator YdeE
MVGLGVTESETTPAVSKPEPQASFQVIGLSVRTTNAIEFAGNGNIPTLWSKFIAEGWAEKIPNRADKNLLAVYTDYASDENGEYTYMVAARVASAAHVPEGMVAKAVPAGKYSVLTSNQGPLQVVIPQMWKRVYDLTPAELGGSRAFTTDYEVYDQRAADPQNAVVELHLALK